MMQKFSTRYPDYKMAYHFFVRPIVPEKIVLEAENKFSLQNSRFRYESRHVQDYKCSKFYKTRSILMRVGLNESYSVILSNDKIIFTLTQTVFTNHDNK